jgi:hypothetical protein
MIGIIRIASMSGKPFMLTYDARETAMFSPRWILPAIPCELTRRL